MHQGQPFAADALVLSQNGIKTLLVFPNPIVEPVMLLVMAGAVLTIILAVMLPILNLNQLVG